MPKPTNLDNISSKDYLTIWDQYVCAILEGSHAFHGAHPSNGNKGATYIAELADAMMELRQERAQGHIDQKEAEKEKIKKAK